MSAMLATTYPGGMWAIVFFLSGIALTLISLLSFGAPFLVNRSARKPVSHLKMLATAHWIGMCGLLFFLLTPVAVIIESSTRQVAPEEFWTSVVDGWQFTLASVATVLFERMILRRVRRRSEAHVTDSMHA